MGDREPTFVPALSLLLGYCYESDKNPIEAFTINEAFEDISLTIIHQLTPPTKRHAKRFMPLFLGACREADETPHATTIEMGSSLPGLA